MPFITQGVKLCLLRVYDERYHQACSKKVVHMSENIGSRLREAREASGSSLRSLASEIGVSPSLLSQIETGKTKPSVSTLYALVSKLNISTDSLLGRDDSAHQQDGIRTGFVPSRSPNETFKQQHATENPKLTMDNGVIWERLSTFDSQDVEALKVTYQPGASSSIEGHLMRHYGIEHMYLMSGELTLRLEFDSHEIKPGDSIAFDSQTPHLFTNNADVPAVGIWYIFGRKFASRENNEHILQVSKNSVELTSAVDVLKAFRN